MLLGVRDTNKNRWSVTGSIPQPHKYRNCKCLQCQTLLKYGGQLPDCHIHISLLVWLPGPLLSQLSGQKVPAPHCTASFAPEWRSEENYNKSCAHFLLMPSKPSVTTPSKTPEKSDTGQLWDQWGLGWGSGKGKQNTQCHGHCQDIPRWQGPAGPSKHLGLEDCKKKQS